VSADPRFQPDLGSLAETLLDDLTAITWRAAAAILQVDPAAADRRLKSDRSPVCAADVVAEAVIVDGLARLLPRLPIVSEEAVAAPRPAAIGNAFALVDPLDGTREFLVGRPEFTVNLAIVVDGTPTVGLVAAPALHTIWRGVAGKRAERLRLPPGGGLAEVRDVARIATRPLPANGIVAAVSRSHFDERTEAFLSRFAIADRIVSGSSLKFCRIAEGVADLYPRLAPIREWDIAAGHAVLAAAGGIVMAPDGTSLTYGQARAGFRLEGFVACGDRSAARKFVDPAPVD